MVSHVETNDRNHSHHPALLTALAGPLTWLSFPNDATSFRANDALLTQPNEADLALSGELQGDTIILGAAGKMGPTLAKRLQRALRSAGRDFEVVAVSQLSVCRCGP